MTTLVPFLLFCQALGALAGAVAAVWSEFVYIRAMRDGRMDAAEREHLEVVGKGLRFGMLLFLISSFGLVVTAYMRHTSVQPALTADYWTFTILALLIIWISWALSRRHISFSFGSAIIFSAWWFLAYLALGWIPPLSFGSALAFFIVATAILYAVLAYLRFISLQKRA